MNIQTMLKHCGISATVHEFASFGGRTVQVTNFDTEQAAFIRSLVSTDGYVHVPSETATAAGMLEFTNNPVFGMELADEVDPALADNTAGTGAPRGSGGAKGDLNDLGGNANARGDGRGFKVLKDGETHKFASKIFTSVLNNNDMARYGAFLYDLDHLFGQYYEEPELEDDGDNMPQRGAQPQQGGGNGGGGADLFEGASAQMDRIAELASNRSEFLKAMMKLMSGDNGERLANSFVAGDAAAFAKAFQVLADKAVAQAGEQTGGDDEEEGDDDADADAGDVEDDGGDDSGSDSDAPDDDASDADADDDGEPNGDNAGGITDRSSSAELEARLKNKPGAKPVADEPRVVVRIPNNRVGDFQ